MTSLDQPKNEAEWYKLLDDTLRGILDAKNDIKDNHAAYYPAVILLYQYSLAMRQTRSQESWFGFLRRTVRDFLNAIGDTASRVFNKIWALIQSAWDWTSSFVAAHPKFTWCLVALVLVILIVLLAPVLLKVVVNLLGFTASGVQAGSAAASIQSTVFGGFVPAGSFFSWLQAFGATAL